MMDVKSCKILHYGVVGFNKVCFSGVVDREVNKA